MNALQSYSSDDEESGTEAPSHKSCKNGDPGTNYDDVGMDISEDSDDEAGSNPKEKSGGAQTGGAASTNSTSSAGDGGGGGGGGTQQLSSSVSDGPKNQNDAKEGQRSSLQERLLGIASGGHRLSADDRGNSSSRKESRSSPSHNREDQDVNRKSKSMSPKVKSTRSQSPTRSSKSSHRRRSRSKSRERDSGRSSQSSRDHTSRSHSSRDQSSQGHSGRGSRDSRDSRRSRDDDRKRREDERRSRRSRSRSRSRERRRSRSRSRDRRSRSRSRERRRRSRSHERKRPMDIRKEAQQKLAALKAANPNITAAELMQRSMEAQVEEVKKQTGITLPSYYNPATMNPMKFAEQERKKKLLWGNKSKPVEGAPPTPGGLQLGGPPPSLYGGLMQPQKPVVSTPLSPVGLGRGSLGLLGSAPHAPSIGGGIGAGRGGGAPGSGQASIWASTTFANDKDGKMASKFRRLMGVKDSKGESNDPPTNSSGISSSSSSSSSSSISNPSVASSSSNPNKGVDLLQKQETMFTSMERQYEMARLATHTHKGFGLGFTSQSFMPK